MLGDKEGACAKGIDSVFSAEVFMEQAGSLPSGWDAEGLKRAAKWKAALSCKEGEIERQT